MEKNFEQLLKDLKTNEQLAQAAKESNLDPTDCDAVIAFAEAHGYTVTVDELEALEDRELTERELEDNISSGGGDYWDRGPFCSMIASTIQFH